MSFSAKPWTSLASQVHPAVSRVLIHFPITRPPAAGLPATGLDAAGLDAAGFDATRLHAATGRATAQATASIQFAVQLAQHSQARLRGLTLEDTTAMEDSAVCESAAYAALQQRRQEDEESIRTKVRESFSQACLAAGLDFDLYRKRGRTIEVLREEARFHDLTITSLPLNPRQRRGEKGHGLRSEDLAKMIVGGVSPLLVLRERGELPQRVLLTQDGSPASGRALRAYLSQELFPEATVRLLAVAATAAEASHCLRESIDAIGRRLKRMETGYLVGRPAEAVPAFARRWEADLVVVGAQAKAPIVGRLFKETVSEVLNETDAALYGAC